MEKARQYSALILSAAALVAAGGGAAHAGGAQSPNYPAGTCSNIAPSTQRRCITARIERKERDLQSALARARAEVARRHQQHPSQDNRGDPAVFDRAQIAWRAFVESNCAIVATYPGGSNSAVSDRIAGCYESELDRRIRFLRDAADETGAFAW